MTAYHKVETHGVGSHSDYDKTFFGTLVADTAGSIAKYGGIISGVYGAFAKDSDLIILGGIAFLAGTGLKFAANRISTASIAQTLENRVIKVLAKKRRV